MFCILDVLPVVWLQAGDWSLYPRTPSERIPCVVIVAGKAHHPIRADWRHMKKVSLGARQERALRCLLFASGNDLLSELLIVRRPRSCFFLSIPRNCRQISCYSHLGRTGYSNDSSLNYSVLARGDLRYRVAHIITWCTCPKGVFFIFGFVKIGDKYRGERRGMSIKVCRPVAAFSSRYRAGKKKKATCWGAGRLGSDRNQRTDGRPKTGMLTQSRT